jgi:DNA polymerase elongation subunit (family B)
MRDIDLLKKEIETLKAEKKKYAVEADSKKITLNGSFGKFGSKYSSLYSPQLLLQTTITGQLSLLMLIEELELNGIRVVSANTDGIVTYYHESQIPTLQDILFNWEIQTSYTLEQSQLRFRSC